MDLSLSHEETTELGAYIRRCEIEKRVLKATDEALTRCEFDRKCRVTLKSFMFGLGVGIFGTYLVINEWDRR